MSKSKRPIGKHTEVKMSMNFCIATG